MGVVLCPCRAYRPSHQIALPWEEKGKEKKEKKTPPEFGKVMR